MVLSVLYFCAKVKHGEHVSLCAGSKKRWIQRTGNRKHRLYISQKAFKDDYYRAWSLNLVLCHLCVVLVLSWHGFMVARFRYCMLRFVSVGPKMAVWISWSSAWYALLLHASVWVTVQWVMFVWEASKEHVGVCVCVGRGGFLSRWCIVGTRWMILLSAYLLKWVQRSP